MDLKKAKKNPAVFFGHPKEVLHNTTLSDEDKIIILKAWEYDARELEVAEEENMVGDSPSLLSDILEALRLLHSENTRKKSAPNKQGASN